MKCPEIVCETCPLSYRLTDEMRDKNMAAYEAAKTDTVAGILEHDRLKKEERDLRMQIAQAIEHCEGPAVERRFKLFGRWTVRCASPRAAGIEPGRHTLPLEQYKA